jgi:abortive infection AbiH-like protein
MKNLVIIGNGFDLAHELKTRYSDFINDMTDNPDKYDIHNIQFVNNKLLKSLVEIEKDLWSDIEYTYYEILKNLDNGQYLQNNFGDVWQYKSVKELNQLARTCCPCYFIK